MGEETAQIQGSHDVAELKDAAGAIDLMMWPEIRFPRNVADQTSDALRFKLSEKTKITRIAFEQPAGVSISIQDCISFVLSSPTSTAMFPDVLIGDRGYPEIRLVNANGSIFRFKRGNVKDFYDFRSPAEPQRVTIPLSCLIYDIDTKINVRLEGSFFEAPLTKVFFDFLGASDEAIEIILGECRIEYVPERPSFSVFDLLIIAPAGKPFEFPLFFTETKELSMQLSVSDMGMYLGLDGARLKLRRHGSDAPEWSREIVLRREAVFVAIPLPTPGPSGLEFQIDKAGEQVLSESVGVVRAVPVTAKLSNKIGLSDEFGFDRISVIGGKFQRRVVTLGTYIPDGTTFRLRHNAAPISSRRPIAGHGHVVAIKGMPSWMSSKEGDYDSYRYIYSDKEKFQNLLRSVFQDFKPYDVTHLEMWNEASVIHEWNDGIVNLVSLHAAIAEVARAELPDLTLLGGCTHTWDFDFLKGFVSSGGASHCDGLAVHGYTYSPERFLEYFSRLEDIVSECSDKTGRPFQAYITEIGFRTPAFSDHLQALYLFLYSLEAAARKSVASLIWFRFNNVRHRSSATYDQNASDGYGMVGYNDRYCRPMIAAYRNYLRLFSKLVSVEVDGSAENRRFFLMDAGGTVSTIVHYSTNGLAPKNLSGFQAKNMYGAPVSPQIFFSESDPIITVFEREI